MQNTSPAAHNHSSALPPSNLPTPAAPSSAFALLVKVSKTEEDSATCVFQKDYSSFLMMVVLNILEIMAFQDLLGLH